MIIQEALPDYCSLMQLINITTLRINSFSENSKNNILIFEDDILYPEQIGLSDFDNALINSPKFDIILLGHCGAVTELFTDPVVKVGSANCTHAYIISREGMRKILETPERYNYPIDKILTQMCSSSKLLCFVSKHVPMVGSNIGGIIHQDTESVSNIR